MDGAQGATAVVFVLNDDGDLFKLSGEADDEVTVTREGRAARVDAVLYPPRAFQAALPTLISRPQPPLPKPVS